MLWSLNGLIRQPSNLPILSTWSLHEVCWQALESFWYKCRVLSQNTFYQVIKASLPDTDCHWQNQSFCSYWHIPYNLTRAMRFSFLLAVVAALASSMSVSACATLNGLCGSSSASGDTCCSGFTCSTGVSMSRLLCIHPATHLCALYQ